MGRRNFLIEGGSGNGKSSVCEELARRGYHVVHGDRELAYQGDPETGAPMEVVTGLAVHDHHLWRVDKVKAIVADQREAVTFLCGGSRNFAKFIDLFNGVFVLEIDTETLARRLDNRRDDERGGQGRQAERDLTLRLHRTKADIPRGGIAIDATAPLVRRRRGLTEQAAVAAVDQACRRLRLPTIRAVLDEALTVAGKEQLSYQGFLAELLLAECDDRDRRSSIRRVKAAGFPRDKWLGDFDFDANPNINPATIHTLATGDWIRKGSPLCLIGDSGTGKSHLLIGLGTAAAETGYRVKYTLATRLVNELVEAADEKVLAKTIARYGRVDLLCIDELGYMELDRRGAELLFQVLTEREEKNSIAIASNESFSGWTKTFTDPRLCAAIVDRLTFNGAIIETGTDSYRLAVMLAQEAR